MALGVVARLGMVAGKLLARLGALARKAKLPKGLTPAEKLEQAKLRKQLAELNAERRKAAKSHALLRPGTPAERARQEGLKTIGRSIAVAGATGGGLSALDALTKQGANAYPGSGGDEGNGDVQPEAAGGGGVVVNVGQPTTEQAAQAEALKAAAAGLGLVPMPAASYAPAPILMQPFSRSDRRALRLAARAQLRAEREATKRAALAESGATARQAIAGLFGTLQNATNHPAGTVAVVGSLATALIVPAVLRASTKPVPPIYAPTDKKDAATRAFEAAQEERAQALAKRTAYGKLLTEWKQFIPDKNLPAGPLIAGAGSVAGAEGKALPGGRGVGAATSMPSPTMAVAPGVSLLEPQQHAYNRLTQPVGIPAEYLADAHQAILAQRATGAQQLSATEAALMAQVQPGVMVQQRPGVPGQLVAVPTTPRWTLVRQ